MEILGKIEKIKELRIIKDEPELIITFPVSLIFIILIVCLKPILRIRVGFLKNDRIGHFAANTELYLCEKKQKREKSIDLFYLPRKNICNRALLKIISRKVIILPKIILRPICLTFRSFLFFKAFSCGITLNEDRDISNLMYGTESILKLSHEEEKIGYKYLERLGLNQNSKFICLTVRDELYLARLHGDAIVSSYHDHRDADISNYIEALKKLTERGYYIFRMGVIAKDKLEINNSKIIDYAFNGHRTELLDIFLGANCHFCISTSTGFDAIPYIFRRPIVYTNLCPIGLFFTFSKNYLMIPKHHYSEKKNAALSFKEIVEFKLGTETSSENFSAKNVKLIQNSSEEILDVVLEMDDTLTIGTGNRTEEGEERQRIFWSKFPVDAVAANDKRLHGRIVSRIGDKFLKENEYFLK